MKDYFDNPEATLSTMIPRDGSIPAISARLTSMAIAECRAESRT